MLESQINSLLQSILFYSFTLYLFTDLKAFFDFSMKCCLSKVQHLGNVSRKIMYIRANYHTRRVGEVITTA